MPGVKGQRSGGRNKKTRKELDIAGTYRKDRHENEQNPDPPAGIPVPPKELLGDALAEWDRMIARLTQMGTLSIVDDAVLYQYCQTFAETEDIQRAQAETEATIQILQENFDGLPREEFLVADQIAVAMEITKLRKLVSGYITKVRQGRMALRMLLTEFGLTPASRGRVKLPDKPKDADEFTTFQQQKPGLVRVK